LILKGKNQRRYYKGNQHKQLRAFCAVGKGGQSTDRSERSSRRRSYGTVSAAASALRRKPGLSSKTLKIPNRPICPDESGGLTDIQGPG